MIAERQGGRGIKTEPLIAATTFVQRHFSQCEVALLAGSVIRGTATPTSDLDLFILDLALPAEYRESFFDGEWMIEAFVHNGSSYQKYFQSDCEQARPCLVRMVAEGVVIKDSPLLIGLKQEASELLARGPKPWDAATIERKRYFITNELLDFIGSSQRQQEIFIAGKLAELLHEFILRTNNQWIGSSKWIWIAMRNYDPEIASQLFAVFDAFYRSGEKEKIIAFTDATLEPFGGRFFAGFSVGKDEG